MTERLKKIDRAILELITGILVFVVLCQLVGLLLPFDRQKYAFGLWSGGLMACVLAVHMWKSLNKAFLCDEKTAAKIMSGGYLIRYLLTAAYLVFLFYTGAGYVLAGFLGVMSLKAGAYLQPPIHKYYNRLFHETDPVPRPLEEQNEVLEAEK
ncbi:MAG: hypothetical protein J1E65_07815 [Lachnospiraceae bacterium]|nr:hypothetical protein [Lachnospiraceae bacterium]